MSLNYFGGKQRKEIQEWILANLPHSYESYVEPFAGMLGILINRTKANAEVANDINNRIVNWWEVVRDKYEELDDKLYWSPASEKLFYDCVRSMDEGTDVERAWKFQVVVQMSRMHTDNEAKAHFSWRIQSQSRPTIRRADSLYKVRDRIKDLQVFNRPAENIIQRCSADPAVVMYCDPPYSTADTSVYKIDTEDHDRLVDLFRDAKCSVAISGYNDEWDELGWVRKELDTYFATGVTGRNNRPRTEVLWMNYQPPQRLLI